MAALIRDRAIVENDAWRLLGEDDSLPDDDTTPVIIPLQRWRDALGADSDSGAHPQTGVLIPNDVDLADIWPLLSGRPLVALDFPAFPDGRAYSQARLLRERYGFSGEIRAIGAAVVHDQIAGMARCGINAFALREDQDAAHCLRAFDAFSTAYQPACDGVEPIWARRRAQP